MIKLNKKYSSIVSSKSRYQIILGGRGSGKSYSVNTIICLMMLEDDRTILFLRKTLTSAHLSIIPEFIHKIKELGLESLFHVTKTEIINKSNGSAIYFRGIVSSSGENTANLKSISNVSCLIIDEAEELTDETVFDRIDLSVRKKGVENKIIIVMNPSTKEHWVYKRFFEGMGVPDGFNGVSGNVNYVCTTYLDNLENLDSSFIEAAELMKEKDVNKYNSIMLGGWLDKAEGVIFNNWELGSFVDTGYTVWGMDWGFSLDPTTLVKVSIDRINKRMYLKEECYKPKMVTSDIIHMLSEKVGFRPKIVADSAEPRLIAEIAQKGFNIHPAIKGPGSISAGISLLLDWSLIIDPESINLIKEANNYKWHDKKSGVPIDNWNHLWDPIRYASSDLIDVPKQQLPTGNLGNAMRGIR